MGNFASTYNVSIGDKVIFSMLEKEGYLSEYLLHQLKRTNERNDYASDSIFANFRSIATTGIKPGLLYRSSSPVNNEIGRAAYANGLAEAVGINTMINLSDSEEDIKAYFEAEGFNSDYYKSLYDAGKVITLNMGVDISGEDFGQKLVQGLRFLINNDGPYLFHCTEGKDRAGFFAALIEALMGASKDEIVEDYMQSYINYFGISKDSVQYNTISNDVIEMLKAIAGTEDLDNVDLSKAAEDYLVKGGVDIEKINALKDKLSTEISYSEEPKTVRTYIGVKGDCLWKIAEKFLGDGRRYIEIYNLNRDKIKNPDLIYVGQELILP